MTSAFTPVVDLLSASATAIVAGLGLLVLAAAIVSAPWRGLITRRERQNALGVAPAASLGGTGVVRQSFGESGFFTYVNWDIRPGHNFKAGYSTAEVDSGDRSRLTITELSKNTAAYVNYGYKATEGLTVFGQLTHFDTEYGVDSADFSALETRIDLLFRF